MRFILITALASIQLASFAAKNDKETKPTKTPILCPAKNTKKSKERQIEPDCKNGKVSVSTEKERISKNPN